jgi:hypothetical protein
MLSLFIHPTQFTTALLCQPITDEPRMNANGRELRRPFSCLFVAEKQNLTPRRLRISRQDAKAQRFQAKTMKFVTKHSITHYFAVAIYREVKKIVERGSSRGTVI